MKPFWHRLQDRIFKPGYDQEAYMELVFTIKFKEASLSLTKANGL